MSDPFDNLRAAISEIIRAEFARLAKPAPVDDYLTVAAAAEFASVSTATIRRWVKDGDLKEHRAGRVLRVKRSDLERLLRVGSSKKRDRDETPEEWARRKFG